MKKANLLMSHSKIFIYPENDKLVNSTPGGSVGKSYNMVPELGNQIILLYISYLYYNIYDMFLYVFVIIHNINVTFGVIYIVCT